MVKPGRLYDGKARRGRGPGCGNQRGEHVRFFPCQAKQRGARATQILERLVGDLHMHDDVSSWPLAGLQARHASGQSVELRQERPELFHGMLLDGWI